MSKPDMTPISRFPDLEKPGRGRLNQLLRLLILTTRGDILTRGETYLKRLAIGSAYQQLRVDSGGDDVEWANLDNIIFTTASELTIDTNGEITITQVLHTVDTFEDASTDDLDTINGNAATNLVFLRAENDGRTIVVKHNTGNIWLIDKTDFSLDDVADGILLVWDGTRWIGINADVAAQIVAAVAAHVAAADPHTGYVKESEFTASEDILVGSGSGTFAKKTPAEVLAILSGDAGAAFSWNDKVLTALAGILTTAESELTIDTDGEITVTQIRHKVDTFEGAASDDLSTINGGTTVNLIILRAEADARTVVLKHGTGNIWLQGKADVSLDDLEDGILLVWDSTNSKWFDIAAGGGGLVADSVDGSHLSQDFGASSGRLLNFVPTPIAGKPLQVGHSSDTQFFGKINGAPTATSVVYDGDSNEGMFNTLVAWDGTNYWGKFVLHNTTKANSRLIEEVNIATNTITTESSTDDWADNDDITCQSQVNAGAQFVDLDLSDQVPTTTKSVLLFVEFIDLSAGAQAARALYLHPYATWNLGKKLVIYCDLASERTTIVFPVEVISQKITIAIDNCTDVIYALTVIGYFEYADT